MTRTLKGQQTLRLSVKRMTKARQVKIDVPATGEAGGGPKNPATPAPGDAADEKQHFATRAGITVK